MNVGMRIKIPNSMRMMIEIINRDGDGEFKILSITIPKFTPLNLVFLYRLYLSSLKSK